MNKNVAECVLYKVWSVPLSSNTFKMLLLLITCHVWIFIDQLIHQLKEILTDFFKVQGECI